MAGTLNSTPSQTFRIQFYAVPLCDPSGSGGGLTFLGETTASTNGSGSNTALLSQLETTVFAPIPTAREPMITAESSGAWSSVRKAERMGDVGYS